MRGRIFLAVLSAGLSLSCSKSFEDLEAIERNETVLERMASNIGFFRDLAVAVEAEGKVAAWIQDTDHVTVYWDNGRVSTVWPDPSVGDAVPPTVSAALQDGRLVWSVNGEVPTKGGKAIPVSDASAPVLSTEDADWVLAVAGERFTFKPDACVKARKACVGIDPSRPMTFRLEPGTDVYVEQPAWFKDLKTRDVNRAFYKDIFLDAGMGLTDRKTLPAADYLGLSMEGVSNSSETYKVWEREILGGSVEDENGRLLYPDGQPRYRVLFVVGGKARNHGKEEGDAVLQRMRSFNAKGGSYVGTCAGGIFASTGFEGETCPYYLHLCPATIKYTGLSSSLTGMFIEDRSPLLDYYDFGGDLYVKDIRHNGGAFPLTLPVGTEVLARYDREDHPNMHRQPSIWAYKADDRHGRVIMEGSHPEEYKSGEVRDLTAAMILYAMDGQGRTELKTVLNNGKTYIAPVGIGDLQCHHFAFWLPDGAERVTLSVEGQADWTICLSQEGFAYPDNATRKSESPWMETGPLEAGMWYFSVLCRTSVTVTETEIGQDYSGRTDVLNGIPYTVSVKWR